MKQLLFCYKDNKILRVRHTIITDVFVPVEDIVSPQKTTLIIPKTNKAELGDIVIIRDNDNGKIEYIGYIDTLVNKSTTEISCYPLINVFDNDYVLDQIYENTSQVKKDENGNEVKDDKGNTVYDTVDVAVDVVDWLKKQLKRAFIDTEDNLQALPLIIRDMTNEPIFYKRILETSNLLEAYIDVFINTGVYVVFEELSYNGVEIDGIYCDIYHNTEEKALRLRYDNPQIQSVDIVDNTFTNYNKIIVTEELPEGVTTREPQRYYFYLLNDNSVTRDANDPRRIKQVRSKEITMGIDTSKTATENAQSMLLTVYNELQAPEYNLQITITMFKNDKIKLYKQVNFVGENGITYTSNVTKIEKLNDKQIKVTLGALRNSLTDFKKKVEAI